VTHKHNPDAEAVLYIRVPGAIKNQVADTAQQHGLSINAWAANIIRLALRQEQGLPAPPPAAAPLPSPAEALHAYLTNTTLTTPCGRTRTCTGLTDPPEALHGLLWCAECGIRLA
jgi:hypothetical protein